MRSDENTVWSSTARSGTCPADVGWRWAMPLPVTQDHSPDVLEGSRARGSRGWPHAGAVVEYALRVTTILRRAGGEWRRAPARRPLRRGEQDVRAVTDARHQQRWCRDSVRVRRAPTMPTPGIRHLPISGAAGRWQH